MKRFKHIFFSEYTQTYRSYPENYWVASVKDNTLVFDSWDGMLKEFKYKNEVIKLHKKIADFRSTQKRLSKVENLTAVIVDTENCNGLGIQFWQDWQIKNIEQTNTDSTKSYFISKL